MLSKEPTIYNSLNALIESIKDSEIYKNYRSASEDVSREPGLQKKIDEFRRRNFMIQQDYEGDDLLREMERFDTETAAFQAQPLVDKYLSAEVDFVRLKQEIDKRMLDALAFSVPGGE